MWWEDPIKIVITNYPEEQTEEMEIENNRAVPEMGSRMVPSAENCMWTAPTLWKSP